MSNPAAEKVSHTPGPWKVIPSLQRQYKCVQLGKDECYTTSPLEPADARLIAAAPDLLAACEAMSAHYSGSLDHQPPYVKLARAAVEKAHG